MMYELKIDPDLHVFGQSDEEEAEYRKWLEAFLSYALIPVDSEYQPPSIETNWSVVWAGLADNFGFQLPPHHFPPIQPAEGVADVADLATSSNNSQDEIRLEGGDIIEEQVAEPLDWAPPLATEAVPHELPVDTTEGHVITPDEVPDEVEDHHIAEVEDVDPHHLGDFSGFTPVDPFAGKLVEPELQVVSEFLLPDSGPAAAVPDHIVDEKTGPVPPPPASSIRDTKEIPALVNVPLNGEAPPPQKRVELTGQFIEMGDRRVYVSAA